MTCLKIFETGQTRLWETQKSKRVEIVSFEVETKKETGIPVNLVDWDSDFFPALSLGLFFDLSTVIF